MRVTVLTAARPVSAEQLTAITDSLRAADGQVEVDVVSWSPVQDCDAVRSATVIGPVRVYRTGADQVESDGSAAPQQDAVDPDPPASPSQSTTDPSCAAGPSLVRRARRLVGRPMWAWRRQVILARRSRLYRRTRRALLGGIPRQFAAGTCAHPDLLHAVRASQIVLALDHYAVPAAWRIARRVPGPVVLNGLPAAERELRARAGS